MPVDLSFEDVHFFHVASSSQRIKKNPLFATHSALVPPRNKAELAKVGLELRQKGVDMRIGVDIASLTLKKQADTIILVAGDSDFVPAAKLARREGIEFILDPLWQQVNPDLFEHIDGLQSGLKRPSHRASTASMTELAVEQQDN